MMMARWAGLAGVMAVWAGMAGPALASGNVSCSEPKEQWRPRVELQRELKAKGWAVRKFVVYNGCYEVYGFDEQDRQVEAFFNPRTFERVYPTP